MSGTSSSTRSLPTTAVEAAPSEIHSSGNQLLRVVSVSLGSSSRDHIAHVELLGHSFTIERRGTDGNLDKACRIIQELDGRVAAIGLGGIDLYVVVGNRRYVLPDAARMAKMAKTTPVVDGSGLKDTLERETIRRLQRDRVLDFKGAKVLLVSAVDRFGMAEQLVESGAHVVFGDLQFLLGVPLPMRKLSTLKRLGSIILPVATRLPYKMLYPTGEKQKTIKSSRNHQKFYHEAEIIAGDFLLIRRYLPDRISGKTILTNTVTQQDIELLRARGARRLITTTPEFEGRSFGTNVMEGVFAALGARTSIEYSNLLQQLGWQPRVVDF
jgi:hypothetical protein